eukprot:4589987-Pyramimonas_sp.AAC.1
MGGFRRLAVCQGQGWEEARAAGQKLSTQAILTIFPEAKIRAVVFGSRIRMMTAAKRCSQPSTQHTPAKHQELRRPVLQNNTRTREVERAVCSSCAQGTSRSFQNKARRSVH